MRLPSATTCAPVSVATSTMAFGFSSAASDNASDSTRRPSASVLSTSIVTPLRARNTSPGLIALGPGMFSVQTASATTRVFTPSAAQAAVALSTAAAPPMSVFIVSMPCAVLSDRPPESNVMPLPTKNSVFFAPGGLYSRRIRRGGWSEPSDTPRNAPRRSFSIFFSSQTVAVTWATPRRGPSPPRRDPSGSARRRAR